MRRKLKFRFWNGLRMMEPSLNILIDSYGGYAHNQFGYEDLNPQPDWLPLQFTGLKDKNGKDIYEGDIVKWDYEYDADYDGDMPIVKRSAGKDYVRNIFDTVRIKMAASEGSRVETIGNIYEHSELMNHSYPTE